MKEKELRECSTCAICHKPIGQSGMPLFWRVTVERYGLNLSALQRQQGLGLMLGAPLAQIMGPNEDMATPIMEPIKKTVCDNCCTTPVMVAQLAEES